MKPRIAFFSVSCLLASVVCFGSGPARDLPRNENRVPKADALAGIDGVVTFDFSSEALDRFGLWFTPRGQLDPLSPSSEEDERDLVQNHISFPLDPSSRIAFDSSGALAADSDPHLPTCGALMLFPTEQRVVVGNLEVSRDESGALVVLDELDPLTGGLVVFYLDSVSTGFDRRSGKFWLLAEVVVDESWAASIGVPEAAYQPIGSVRVEGSFAPALHLEPRNATCANALEGGAAANAASTGPDVIVGDLQSVMRYTQKVGDITAFAVGTTSCNVGTARASWVQHTNAHPVIIQNIYRLDNRGFQQIGMSWLKHGFYAVSQSLCTPCNDPTDGTQLGVGCSDPYEAPLNGDQSNMSPRATLNAHTGYFPYPWSGPGWANTVARRIQVYDADLDPAQNIGARYFVEGHYLMADDSAAGNADNNASYRQAFVINPSAGVYSFTVDGLHPTQRGQAAVRAWKDIDPTVEERDVRVPGEGLMILAGKATEIGGGWYRYQYALQNLNSDRCAREFKVALPAGAVVQNVGFHDINHHSGEPFSTTDWSSAVQGGYVDWWGQTYEENVNANALRFGTVFSFSFECNVEPAPSKIYIGLFKPGFPADLAVSSIGPRPELIDCNENGIADECDLSCAGLNCDEPCGGSLDCDTNGVPDECEQDCDENGIPDECDIADCAPGDLLCADCNDNHTPDGCEPDCNGDQIPEDCVPPGDADGDGFDDCTDLCPFNTPPGACALPDVVTCRFANGMCIQQVSLFACIGSGGTAICGEPPETRCEFGTPCLTSKCKTGCLLGDCNRDADIDLSDFQMLQNCFSGSEGSIGYLPPSAECMLPLNTNEDVDVDLEDYREFRNQCAGPLGD